MEEIAMSDPICPEGYRLLPRGMACKCLRLYRRGGRLYCCNAHTAPIPDQLSEGEFDAVDEALQSVKTLQDRIAKALALAVSSGNNNARDVNARIIDEMVHILADADYEALIAMSKRAWICSRLEAAVIVDRVHTEASAFVQGNVAPYKNFLDMIIATYSTSIELIGNDEVLEKIVLEARRLKSIS